MSDYLKRDHGGKGNTAEKIRTDLENSMKEFMPMLSEESGLVHSANVMTKMVEKQDRLTSSREKSHTAEHKTTSEMKKQSTLMGTISSLTNSLVSGFERLALKAKTLASSLMRGVKYLLTGVVGVKAGFNLKEVIDQGNKVVENANLMAVSFNAVTDAYGNIDMAASPYYSEALQFQKDLHKYMQLEIADLSKIQSTFNYMYSNQGVSQELATRMSKNLTGMAQDLASLYNTEFTDQANKIASGLTGMTKGLRLEGIDLSNDSLQQTLDNLDIDAKARSLSYANKELLRYITLWEQTNKAQGDFARTSTTSANQLKMLQNQIGQTGAMIGMIFAQAFSEVLLYIRAIVMVVQEFVRIIGNLLGVDWNMTGIQSAIGAYDDLGDSVDDVGDSFGGASKKAKEFKKQLMGFDEINNITPPTQSSGGGGGGGGVDITDQLMKALDLRDWDTHMESIRDKAREYADAIMNALGFTKKLNGEWEWNIKNLSPVAKVLGAIGAVIAGIVTGIKGLQIMAWISKIPIVQKGLEALVSTFKALATAQGGVLGAIKALASGFVEMMAPIAGQIIVWGSVIALSVTDIILIVKPLIDTFKDLKYAVENNTGAFKDSGEFFDVFFAHQAEFVGNILDDIYELVEKLPLIGKLYEGQAEEFRNLTGIQSKAVRDATESMTKDYKKFNDQLDRTLSTYDRQLDGLKATELETESYCKALDQVVTSDGKVKKGKEDLADYILNQLSKATGEEYKRDKDQILINGKMVSSNGDVRESIKKLIDEQKKQIETEKIKAKLEETIKKQAEIYADVLELEAEKLANNNKLSEEKEAKLKTLKEEYRLLTNDVSAAQDELVLNTAKNTELLTNDLVTSFNNMETNAQDTSDVLKKTVTDNWEHWKDTYEKLEGKTDEETKYFKEKMLALSTDTTNINENIRQEWQRTSEENAEAFGNSLTFIKEENRQALLDVIDVTSKNAPVLSQAYFDLGEAGVLAFGKRIDTLDDKTFKAVMDAVYASYTNHGAGSEFVKYMAILGESGVDGFDDYVSTLDTTVQKDIRDARDELKRSAPDMYENGKYVGKRTGEGVDSGFNETKIDASNSLTYNKSKAQSIGEKLRAAIIVGLGSLAISAKTATPMASGGYLSKGQFFVAREAGPELVGNIGNKSAVMNNMQIVAAVSGGVARAVSSVLAGGGFTMTLPELPQNNFSNDPQMATSIASAIISGLREQPLTADVNINAHTDDGVIFEKSTQGIQDFVRQTGELPFEIPI